MALITKEDYLLCQAYDDFLEYKAPLKVLRNAARQAGSGESELLLDDIRKSVENKKMKWKENKQEALQESRIFNDAIAEAEKPIFDEQGRYAYQVMRRKPGDQLEKFNLSTFSFIDRLELVIQLFQKIQLLHRKGYIHLDIKGANVLVGMPIGGDGKKELKCALRHELSLIDTGLSQDFGLEDINTLKPMDRALEITSDYFPEETVNRQEKRGQYIPIYVNGKQKQSMVSAKTDIHMAATQIVYRVFDGPLWDTTHNDALSEDKYPVVFGIKVKTLLDAFLNKMSEGNPDQRPPLQDCQNFFQALYVVALTDKYLKGELECPVKEDQKEAQEQNITNNLVKLMLVESGLWKQDYASVFADHPPVFNELLKIGKANELKLEEKHLAQLDALVPKVKDEIPERKPQSNGYATIFHQRPDTTPPSSRPGQARKSGLGSGQS